jgi:hypothetical protein
VGAQVCGGANRVYGLGYTMSHSMFALRLPIVALAGQMWVLCAGLRIICLWP